jgi:hypothetical protein
MRPCVHLRRAERDVLLEVTDNATRERFAVVAVAIETAAVGADLFAHSFGQYQLKNIPIP